MATRSKTAAAAAPVSDKPPYKMPVVEAKKKAAEKPAEEPAAE